MNEKFCGVTWTQPSFSCTSVVIADVFVCLFIYLFLARKPPVGHDLLIHEVSRSHTHTHNDTPHSVELLGTSDQLVAETST